MRESELQNQIRAAIGFDYAKTCRLFRNNVGSAKTFDNRYIEFGLCVGSSDLIGFQSVTITADMVGQQVAIFTAIEVKTPTGKVSAEQKRFTDMVNNFGGIGAIVRSVDDAREALK